MSQESKYAIVVLSGGQDSTTVLHYALAEGYAVYALTFDYGQRHVCEIDAAKRIAAAAHVKHEVLTLPGNVLMSSMSPLVGNDARVVQDMKVGQYDSVEDMPSGIEQTFVEGRNLLFLTLAANRAAALGTKTIFIGVGQEDFGGYPDCRASFVRAMELTVDLAMGWSKVGVHINAPLMHRSKKQTVELALRLDGRFTDDSTPCFDALAISHTCYQGKALPCLHCHACIIRARGFRDAVVADPMIVRLKAVDGLAGLPEECPDHGFVVEED